MNELYGILSLGGTVIGGSLYQRGLKGETGNGIASVVMESNYDLTITYTNGDVVTLDTGLDEYQTILEGIKADAEAAQAAAETAETNAAASESAAATSASEANTYAGNAAASAQTATTKAADALAYAGTAEGYASNAQAYMLDAQGYASGAETAQGKAEDAADAAAQSASVFVVDADLDDESENPVQNKVITGELDKKIELEDIETLLPTDTASGAIASFPDGSNLAPAKSLKVSIDPIQSLHGYDSPWVGGAGKNLLDPSYANRTNEGITYAPTSDGKIKITGTATANSYSAANATNYANTWIKLKAGTYTLKVSGLLGDNKQRLYVGAFAASGESVTVFPTVFGDFERTFTISEDFGIWYWIYTAKGAVLNTIVEIQLEQDTTATAFEPYSNICPISGRTEVVTHRTGKNLLQPKFYSGIGYNNSAGTTFTLTDITDTFTETDGVFSKSVSALGGASMVSEALPNGSYCINVAVVSSGLRLTGYILDVDYKVIRQFDLIGSGTSYSENRTITLSDSETYIALYVASNVRGSISFGKPQIELGSTATAYEPYQVHTYTTDLPQTVYGGTLDVVTGVLTVDRAMVDMGSLTYSRIASSAGVYMFITYPTGIKTAVEGEKLLACEIYNAIPTINANIATDAMLPNGSVCQSNGGASVRIRDDNYTDPNEFKSSVNGHMLAIPLSTPQTYTLTPQTINTLSGVNNVWSEQGSVAVVYKADVQRWVEKKLA